MAKLKPFESDGCTVVPDLIFKECCLQHDLDYHRGGPLRERWRADVRYWRCMRRRIQSTQLIRSVPPWDLKEGPQFLKWAGYHVVALLYFIGVVALAWPWMPMPNARWGFGYPWPRYKD